MVLKATERRPNSSAPRSGRRATGRPLAAICSAARAMSPSGAVMKRAPARAKATTAITTNRPITRNTIISTCTERMASARSWATLSVNGMPASALGRARGTSTEKCARAGTWPAANWPAPSFSQRPSMAFDGARRVASGMRNMTPPSVCAVSR